MKRNILLVPFFVIGLLSFKTYSKEEINSTTASNYERLSNTSAQYIVSSKSTYCKVSDFSFSTRGIKKGNQPKCILSNMPSGNSCWVYFDLYYEDGTSAFHQQHYKKKTGATSTYFTIQIPTGLVGFVHGLFRINCPIFGFVETFAEFDLFLGWEDGNNNIFNRKQFVPSEIYVSQSSGITKMYGDYFELRRLPSTIEVDEYGTFYFNDLNIELYREYYGNTDYARFGQFYLTHEYNFFLNGNKDIVESLKRHFLELTKNNDNLETLTLSNNNSFYVNQNDNSVYLLNEYSNLKETKDIFFPVNKYEDFNETTFYIGLSSLGRSEFYFSAEFKVKFIKNKMVQRYEIIGEIDKKLEDKEVEDITL